MFRHDNANHLFLVPMDNDRLPYNCNAVPQMQYYDALVGSNGSNMNMIGNINESVANIPMKLNTAAPIFSQQNDGICWDEGGQGRTEWKQIPVCTGLKLSYGEEEHNSSISSAAESAMVKLSSVLSHDDNLQIELARQSNELDQYIRIQKENSRKGILELQHHHTISVLKALEKDVDFRMREKDAVIEDLNRKNKELEDKFTQVALEAKSWHYRAIQNESLVNALQTNIEVFQQKAALFKEGYDENMVDDAVSSCNHNPPSVSISEPVMCRGCKSKEVCVLLLPCRHLCLCTDCEAFIEICPVCRVEKARSLQVFTS